MRRHAEGLVILAGARQAGAGAPRSGWSTSCAAPCRGRGLRAGFCRDPEAGPRWLVRPVADVIHLLAELIENATTLSPPYLGAGVRDTVANGFVIEVEDRGLGMSLTRLAELNDRLANPPEFNPSDSEQLACSWSASWPSGTDPGHAEGLAYGARPPSCSFGTWW